MARPDGTAHVQWMLAKWRRILSEKRTAGSFGTSWYPPSWTARAGHDYGEYPVYEDWSAESRNPVRREFGRPTVERLTHDVTFNWWDDYPPMPPKNYETWSDDISYGPEGYRPRRRRHESRRREELEMKTHLSLERRTITRR